MAKGHKTKKKGTGAKKTSTPRPPGRPRPWSVPLIAIAAALLVFYWTPLFSARASIHWDAVDVHYSLQKYFSEAIRGGSLPQWTPFTFSGFPLLADPQIGAWYPLHWPFFVFGVSPGSIQLQIVLHCLIALLGAYLLAREYFARREVALIASFAYGFSGYFAGHSSHIGMFEAAAWLPGLLFCLRRASLTGRPAWMVLSGVVVGLIALVGHFQTALYIGLAAAAWCAAQWISDRRTGPRAGLALLVAALLGLLIGAVLIVPGWELTGHSIRAGMDFSDATSASLDPIALTTLFYPNALGAIDGSYSGPGDVTQFYFYGGLLLLPLAVLGLRKGPALAPALALTVPAFWYGLGPSAGLHRALSFVPGFGRVRAPVHIWFVVALGLSLLAAAGSDWLLGRRNVPYLPIALPLLLFLDVFYWNSAVNPLAYERVSFDSTYGAGLQLFESRVARGQPELTRFHAPSPVTTFGPLNHPLLAQTETTYGYNPLELRRYHDYVEIAKRNPKLLDTLGVSRWLDIEAGAVRSSATFLPRAHFPKTVVPTAGAEQARDRLGTLEPASTAVAVMDAAPRQDPNASAEIVAHEAGRYLIRCRTASDSLLRIAVPLYPGWRATIDGAETPILEVDYALMGVLVPAGEHEVEMTFSTRGLAPSAAISLITGLSAIIFLFLRRRTLHPDAAESPGASSG